MALPGLRGQGLVNALQLLPLQVAASNMGWEQFKLSPSHSCAAQGRLAGAPSWRCSCCGAGMLLPAPPPVLAPSRCCTEHHRQGKMLSKGTFIIGAFYAWLALVWQSLESLR